MRNTDLQRKTEDVQKQFEKLMNEMVSRRTGGKIDVAGMASDDMQNMYAGGCERKHKSPTKRLISHKNSTWEHKKRIYTGIMKEEYSQTYCISPGKTYVIEAQGGELPYDIAEKSPSKFYKQVLGQNIKRYSVKMRGKLTYEWTQRPLLRLISTIKNKLIQKIGENIGEQFTSDIVEAFAKGGDLEGKILNMVENEQIELLDQN
mmetsp:Transcript_2308/g.3948  ORF Transcript_2308/g.3948 Transcript_2308/m.3948 type:complete len:204 (+) Transcript_2308:1098-1709(+)